METDLQYQTIRKTFIHIYMTTNSPLFFSWPACDYSL